MYERKEMSELRRGERDDNLPDDIGVNGGARIAFGVITTMNEDDDAPDVFESRFVCQALDLDGAVRLPFGCEGKNIRADTPDPGGCGFNGYVEAREAAYRIALPLRHGAVSASRAPSPRRLRGPALLGDQRKLR